MYCSLISVTVQSREKKEHTSHDSNNHCVMFTHCIKQLFLLYKAAIPQNQLYSDWPPLPNKRLPHPPQVGGAELCAYDGHIKHPKNNT